MRRSIIIAAGAALALPLALAGCSSDSSSPSDAVASAKAAASEALSSAAGAASEAVSSAAGAASDAASALATAAAGLVPGSAACQDLQSKVAALSSDGFNSGADLEEGDLNEAVSQLKDLSNSAEGIVSGLGSQAPAGAQQWLTTTQEFAAKLEEATKSGNTSQAQLQQLISQYNTPAYQQQSGEIANTVKTICAG